MKIFYSRSHGVMVSTLDFESSDPSSNLGGTLLHLTPWRNGSASDSRSEGCVFKSRRGQLRNLFQASLNKINFYRCMWINFLQPVCIQGSIYERVQKEILSCALSFSISQF